MTQDAVGTSGKTLYLLRHAKSSWSNPGLHDVARPLNARGRSAAVEMGRYLADHAMAPDLILCSVSQRTRETLAHVLPALASDTVIRIETPLYGASSEELLERLKRVDDKVASVMVIGHNPGIEDLARALATAGPKAEIARLVAKYPTTALTVLQIAANRWGMLAPEHSALERFVVPSNAKL